MKTKFSFVMMLLTAAISCNKSFDSVQSEAGCSATPITFSVSDDLQAGVSTKAVGETTTLSTIYVTASSGDATFNEKAWTTLADAAVSMNGNTGTSDAYWPIEGNLHFYATSWSCDKYVESKGASVTLTYAGGSQDYVAGLANNVMNGTTAQLTMEHVLSRLYDVKFKASPGSSVTISKVTVLPKITKGIYYFRTKEWKEVLQNAIDPIVLNPSQATFSSSLFESMGQGNIDRTFIPGKVTLQVEYTVTANGYKKGFIKRADLDLKAGKKSTVMAELTDDKTAIQFNVTVAPWEAEEVPATLN